ncbi:MAG: GNAT family N-acetyltransferase [Firmicutes bacterium]|nr:GNAT family N-acetyltransferase [Bacillota bacterium]
MNGIRFIPMVYFLKPVRLVYPSVEYKESFIAANEEYKSMGEAFENIEKLEADFVGYIDRLNNYRKGIDLPENWVPYTTFWLVEGNEGNEYIGTGYVRHALTNNLKAIGGHIGYGIRPSCRRKGYGRFILKLLLEEAAKLGIRNALVTCSPDNEGSKRIIEANGGILLDEIIAELDGKPRKTLRYRINTGFTNNMLWDEKGIWYHGSPHVFDVLRAGSTITQDEKLARAFSHKPSALLVDDCGGITHNGTQPGFLYAIDEAIIPGEDIYLHPRTTMTLGKEWLTVRELKVRLIDIDECKWSNL